MSMKIKDFLFWIFAIIQATFGLIIVSVLLEPSDAGILFWTIPLVISTIIIEYLIYSKR